MNKNSHLQGIKPSLKEELYRAESAATCIASKINPTFLNVGSLDEGGRNHYSKLLSKSR